MKNHLLIVDDDKYTVDIYNMIIGWSDYQSFITTETHPLKAMEKLYGLYQNAPENFPDFILLDLRMPEMHGFDFIRVFKEKFPCQVGKTRFIITTSSVIQKEKEEALKFPEVEDFIIKPIPENYIKNLVTKGFAKVEK